MSEDGEVCLTDGATVTDLAKSGIVHLTPSGYRPYTVFYMNCMAVNCRRSAAIPLNTPLRMFHLRWSTVKAGYGFIGWSGTEIYRTR